MTVLEAISELGRKFPMLRTEQIIYNTVLLDHPELWPTHEEIMEGCCHPRVWALFFEMTDGEIERTLRNVPMNIDRARRCTTKEIQ